MADHDARRIAGERLQQWLDDQRWNQVVSVGLGVTLEEPSKPCLHLYVQKKRGLAIVPNISNLPTDWDGFPVVISQVGPIVAQ